MEMKELFTEAKEVMQDIRTNCKEIKTTCKDINKTCYKMELKYYDEPVVRIYNGQQAYFYLINGAKAVEYYCDPVAKRIVYVFRKADTNELYTQWLANNPNK